MDNMSMIGRFTRAVELAEKERREEEMQRLKNLLKKYIRELGGFMDLFYDAEEELDKEREKHARATKHCARAKDTIRNLERVIEGHRRREKVLEAYIASILAAYGGTSEETGVELDISEVAKRVADPNVGIGIISGDKIKVFVRE